MTGLPIEDARVSGTLLRDPYRTGRAEALLQDRGMVLVVDDNPDNLHVLGAMLSDAGYTVRYALSGELALRSLDVALPDLVLLDIRMPGMDGYETCRQMQIRERSRNIPVIFISAMQDSEDKLAGFRVGGADFVSKPFDEQEVLARVRTHIQLHGTQKMLELQVQERTRELASSEMRYRVLFDESPLAVMVYDSADWTILAVNTACGKLLGYAREDLAMNLPSEGCN